MNPYSQSVLGMIGHRSPLRVSSKLNTTFCYYIVFNLKNNMWTVFEFKCGLCNFVMFSAIRLCDDKPFISGVTTSAGNVPTFCFL